MATEPEAETWSLGREDLKWEGGMLELAVSTTWFRDGRAEECNGGNGELVVLRTAILYRD